MKRQPTFTATANTAKLCLTAPAAGNMWQRIAKMVGTEPDHQG